MANFYGERADASQLGEEYVSPKLTSAFFFAFFCFVVGFFVFFVVVVVFLVVFFVFAC